VEGFADGGGMPAKEHPGAHGDREPLVRVARDRIRGLDAREMARRRGERIAAPPHAASTWNQRFSDRQKRARSGNGSIAPAAVVPAVPTTMKGANPRRRSSATCRARSRRSMVRFGSVATVRIARRPRPVMCAILLNE